MLLWLVKGAVSDFRLCQKLFFFFLLFAETGGISQDTKFQRCLSGSLFNVWHCKKKKKNLLVTAPTLVLWGLTVHLKRQLTTVYLLKST